MEKNLLAQSLKQVETGKPSNGPDKTAISEEEKKARLAHWDVMLTLWAGMHDMFGYSWDRQYGQADEDTIKTWARATYSKSAYCLPALELVMDQWTDDFPPTLPQFRTFIALAYDNAQRNRPAPVTPPARQLPETVDKRTEPTQTRLDEIAKQKAIRKQPQTRDASFRAAYDFLGLSKRWGPLPKEETEQ